MGQTALSTSQIEVARALARAGQRTGSAFTYDTPLGQPGVVHFVTTDQDVPAAVTDLRRLQRAGYLTLRWSGQFHAAGELTAALFADARRDFAGPGVLVTIYRGTTRKLKRIMKKL